MCTARFLLGTGHLCKRLLASMPIARPVTETHEWKTFCRSPPSPSVRVATPFMVFRTFVCRAIPSRAFHA